MSFDCIDYLFYNKQPIPIIQSPSPCLIFLNLVVNTIMGTFFAIYTWNNPDKAECYSWLDSNAAIVNPIGIDNAKNVTQQFHVWFLFGFIISLCALMYSIFATIFLCCEKSFFLGLSNTFMFLALLGNLGWTVCGTVFRYKHYGRVCSGDFFNEELYSKVPPFQWKSGRFIFTYLLILWLFWIMFFLGSIILYLYCLLKYKKK